MRLIRTRDRWLCLGVAMLVVLADRALKCLVMNNEFIMNGNSVTAVKGVFSISFAWNTGAAFSLLQGRPGLVALVSAAVLLALAGIVFLPERLEAGVRYPMAAVLGGGAANLIDRLAYGAVADFIRLDFMNFPIFNPADAAVTLGVVLFGIFAFFPRGRKGGSR